MRRGRYYAILTGCGVLLTAVLSADPSVTSQPGDVSQTQSAAIASDAETAALKAIIAADLKKIDENLKIGRSYPSLYKEMAKQHLAQWRKAAALGDPGAMCLLGGAYYYGIGVPQDRKRTVTLAKRAAESGDPRGMYYYANVLTFGGGGAIEVDFKKSAVWRARAAEKGWKSARASYGWSLLKGMGVERNAEKGLAMLNQAAHEKYTPAIVALGNLYSVGDYVPRDEKRAFAFFKQAAELGNFWGVGLMGHCYLNGVGVEKDVDRGIALLRMVILKGNASSVMFMGRYFLNNGRLEEGLALLEKAAADGNYYAAYELGCFYAFGPEDTRDGEKAVKYYTRAATLDYVKARLYLGLMYRYGAGGVEEDIPKARKWLKEAAARGNALAMLNLGLMCFDSDETADGRKWLLKAVEGGEAEAIRVLGEYYLLGLGGFNQDESKGLKLLRRAAALKEDIAREVLREHYFEKATAAKDQAEKLRFHKRAAYFGNELAKEWLKEYYRSRSETRLERVGRVLFGINGRRKETPASQPASAPGK